MICDDCSKDKEDVDAIYCPYLSEIEGEDVEANLCDDCYLERANDI